MRSLDYRAVRDEIVEFIASEVRAAGARGIAVGISGGVDSATVAVLSRLALGDGVVGLLLPCYTREEDMLDAKLVADKFGIRTERIDLAPAYDALLSLLPAGNQVARANLKPRLRMITLFYYANNLNYLVAGTGNKSELMVGYFTKYGDGGVDFLPIGALYKSEVRELARLLDIPERIITKVPSAGLWEGQTDEGELGITYPELDAILVALEQGKEPNFPPEAVDRVKQLIRNSEHKRRPLRVCEPPLVSTTS